MSVELFVTLLIAFSTLSSVITEAVKSFLDGQGLSYSSNIVVLIVSLLVGGTGLGLYLYFNGSVIFCADTIIFMILMGISCAVSAMVGYDKIIQTIKQIGGLNG